MPGNHRNLWAGYFLAVGATAAVAVVRLVLSDVLGQVAPFLPFILAVTVAAWYGGLRPGLLATALSAATGIYLFTPPHYSFRVENEGEFAGVAFTLVIGVTISWLCETMHSARRRAEMQKESLRVTLASIGDAVIATDLEGRVALMNPVAEALSGWKQDEAAGRPLEEVFHIVNEATRQTVENPVRKALAENHVVGLANHTVLIAKGGTERPIDDSAAPIRDAEGRVVGVVLVFHDITERRRDERRLLEREERYRALAATAQVVWTTDPEGQAVEDSPSWRAFTGQTYEQWKGWGWLEAIHPDDRERTAKVWSDAVAGKTICQTEYRVLRADGEFRWTAVRAVPVVGPDGRIREWVGTNADITGKRGAEEERQKFVSLVESSSDFIGMCDLKGVPFFTNEAGMRLVGLDSLEQVRRTPVKEFFFPEDQAFILDEFFPKVLREGHGEVEVRFRQFKTGEPLWMIYNVFALTDAEGRPVGLATVSRNISERKRAEEQLASVAAENARLVEDLRVGDRRKDEFLAVLAHELRNPLAPLRNGLQVMKLARTNGEAVEQSRAMMERQLGQMVRLIDDLMDVSRISRGKVELRKERVELAKVVQQAVETSRPAIEQAGHELTINMLHAPIFVDADVTRLAQVFSNLLNNAAKYTERGGQATLTVERQGSDAVVSVRDTGVGIPAHMLPRVFELFTQVDRSLEKSQGGLGIGLSLVKGLVEMHGGSVEAKSEGCGMGSEFVVRLPLLVESPKSPPADGRDGQGAASARQPKRRILVADDNEDSVQSLAMMLSVTGHEVRTAYDGLGAVGLAGEFRPDVILLDIGMPTANALQLLENPRSCAKYRMFLPARFRLTFNDPLLGSPRNKDKANRFRKAVFSAAVRSYKRRASSRNTTSNTQCRPFSMLQWPRMAFPIRRAFGRRLLIK